MGVCRKYKQYLTSRFLYLPYKDSSQAELHLLEYGLVATIVTVVSTNYKEITAVSQHMMCLMIGD